MTLDMTEKMLDGVPDATTVPIPPNARTIYNGRNPSYYSKLLAEFVNNDNLDSFNNLVTGVSEGEIDLQFYGYSFLSRAICNNNYEKVRYLLRQGATMAFDNRNAMFAVCKVIDYNHQDCYLDIIKQLIDMFFDEEARKSNQQTDPSLFWYSAIVHNRLNVMKYLSEKDKDKDKNSKAFELFLDIACKHGSNDIIEDLIERGIDIHRDDEKPLCLAITGGHIDTMELLIKHGANLNCKRNVLCCAVKGGHLKMVKHLIGLGLDIHINNDEPTKLAYKNGRFPILHEFLKNGLDVSFNNYFLLRNAETAGRYDIVADMVREHGLNPEKIVNKSKYRDYMKKCQGNYNKRTYVKI